MSDGPTTPEAALAAAISVYGTTYGTHRTRLAAARDALRASGWDVVRVADLAALDAAPGQQVRP